MDAIRIRGGRPLKGTVRIGGAKNAALPLMIASLLTEDTLTLGNLPHLTDIATLANLLAQHGVQIEMAGGAPNGGHVGRVLSLTAGEIVSTSAPYDLVRRMRASVLVMGPLLARCGEARVSLPGGCAIGTRPVDLHLNALAQLGAEVELSEGYINLAAPRGLKGTHIVFPVVSVGATENLLMTACLVPGETVLANAAREPEVADLARCLTAMGAEIDGIGTDTLRVRGVARLHGAAHDVLPDRIETGTYAAAAAITGGELVLEGAQSLHLDAVIDAFARAGVEIAEIAGIDGIP
ncbi:MAG: UDP-N-acetylglucosamine 1-carboxyvinyltransferase, partial [Alphaproteobacteria bacterium]